MTEAKWPQLPWLLLKAPMGSCWAAYWDIAYVRAISGRGEGFVQLERVL